MAAVVPRLPAAKQRREVGVKILKGPVHLLESRHIHFPAPLPKRCLTSPSSYHINRRCNTRGGLLKNLLRPTAAFWCPGP